MTKFYIMIAALVSFASLAIFGKMDWTAVGAITAMSVAYFASKWADHKHPPNTVTGIFGISTKLIATLFGIALEAVLAILGKLTPEFAVGITTVVGGYCNFRYQDHKWAGNTVDRSVV